MKSMKKLVLVGVVLLASVMILVGCKMEAGGAKVYTFPAAVKVLTDYESPNNTDDTWTYVAFGEWPQSEAKDVEENSLKVVDGGRGYFKDNYYMDNNDNFYVKHNGSYYNVEPIVWRVLNKDYASTGQALLLAEKILTGGIPYYVDLNKRTIAGAKEGESDTVYPNNYKYSTIRAWLNGKAESDDTQEKNEAYEGTGFLQTAFTPDVHDLIANTIVDNSAASTTDAGQNLPQATAYACGNTEDKIFLLSEQEATTEEYGFTKYDAWGEGNTRIRVTTDYAEATGAYQDSTAGYGGWWWLRSPDDYDYYIYCACDIDYDGDASNHRIVDNVEVGVVPALCIQLQ